MPNSDKAQYYISVGKDYSMPQYSPGWNGEATYTITEIKTAIAHVSDSFWAREQTKRSFSEMVIQRLKLNREPEYKQATVYKDDNGKFWLRISDGWKPFYGEDQSNDAPKRPLVKMVPEK